ncbi:MAG: demethoxyubiquinone hydroxylase family protein [Candidatus Loosdrechtia sp.]|uniref:demethoxyubiquinone hydroxylase family protein n=1 Tax=Candidatus Loosdrechtia sp. TaxID=3101272 RepID=UPI003A6543FE|nr:MAG: demethoxyubiquinone hydroxylase family protein [Candidatus Jettenia sp. AMX2]
MVIDHNRYDIKIICPQMREEDFRLRREPMPRARRRAIIKALRVFHNLETMAVTIYRFQITKEASELNRQLITAMCNEMTHHQDFQVKLYEYGARPSVMRMGYWIIGFCFGFLSRLLGKRQILRTGIWVETKAVHHYAKLLEDVEWDADVRQMIEKDQNDEDGHINRWKTLLESGNY